MTGLLSRIFGRRIATDSVIHQDQEVVLFCPSCGDEYRPGFTRCGLCQRELVRRAPVASPGDTAPKTLERDADVETVTIRQGPVTEIKRQQRLLHKAGIPTRSSVVGTAGCGSSCRPTAALDLQIRLADQAAAEAILDADYRRTTALDSLPIDDEEFLSADQHDTQSACAGCGMHLPEPVDRCPDCGLSYPVRLSG